MILLVQLFNQLFQQRVVWSELSNARIHLAKFKYPMQDSYFHMTLTIQTRNTRHIISFGAPKRGGGDGEDFVKHRIDLPILLQRDAFREDFFKGNDSNHHSCTRKTFVKLEQSPRLDCDSFRTR